MGNLTIWFIAAAVSIATTHYLLYEAKQHYPFHFLMLHLFAASTLKIARTLWALSRTSSPSPIFPLEALRAWIGPWQVLYVGCTITSLVFGYRAMFDLTSITTVAMIMALEWQPELLVGGLPSDLRNGRGFTMEWVLRIIGFAFGILAIYLRDYRLLPRGITWSCLCAAVTAGARFAGVRMTAEASLYRKTEGDRLHRALPNVSVLLIGTPVALLIVNLDENRPTTHFSPWTAAPVTLIANVVASAVALDNCGHIFRRLTPSHDEDEGTILEFLDKAPFGRALMSIALVQAAVSISGAIGYPFVTSKLQYCGFLAATMASLTWDDFTQAADIARMMTGHSGRWRWQSEIHRSSARTDAEASLLCDSEYVCDDSVDSKRSGWTAAIDLWTMTVLLTGALLAGPTVILSHSSVGTPGAVAALQQHTTGTAVRGNRPLDLVIARYAESADLTASQINALDGLPNIAPLDPNVIVYNKAKDANQTALADDIAAKLHRPLRVTVRASPNVGREAEAYLHHITEYWDDLADHTIFLQADPHNPYKMRRRIQDYFVPNTGFLSLGMTGHICTTCDESCVDANWTEEPQVLQEIYSNFNNGSACKDMVFTYRGQFIVSAARIQQNQRQTFVNLNEQLVNPESKKHQSPYLDQTWMYQFGDSLNAPAFGYSLERMWGVIFRCSEKRVAFECPSLLAGVLGNKMPIESCQCLDDVD